MKLDRNINDGGLGKYALVLMRRLYADDGRTLREGQIERFLQLIEEGIVDPGTRDENEFFVIRLKDKYAEVALRAYAAAARMDDPEYAEEIDDLADRAGPNNPHCKLPD